MLDLAVSNDTEIIAKVQKTEEIFIDDFQSSHLWGTDSSLLDSRSVVTESAVGVLQLVLCVCFIVLLPVRWCFPELVNVDKP